MQQEPEKTRTIQETNALVRTLVEIESIIEQEFWIGGTIERYHQSDLGHVYFNLVDNDFSIRCMIPNAARGITDFPLSDGMMVDVYGTLSVFEKRAEVQIQVRKMRLVDKGAAKFDPDAIEELKRKGIWPRERLDLPNNIQNIALITSKNSKGLEDFRTTFYASGGVAKIDPIDSLVQGAQAPQMLQRAIQRANEENKADVIALVRGGGRHEDLSAYNDIRVVEAICLSKIPVVTGIGHQQDETLADRAADHKAITPTAAAVELAKYSKAVPTTNDPIWFKFAVGVGVIVILLLLALIIQNL